MAMSGQHSGELTSQPLCSPAARHPRLSTNYRPSSLAPSPHCWRTAIILGAVKDETHGGNSAALGGSLRQQVLHGKIITRFSSTLRVLRESCFPVHGVSGCPFIAHAFHPRVFRGRKALPWGFILGTLLILTSLTFGESGIL